LDGEALEDARQNFAPGVNVDPSHASSSNANDVTKIIAQAF
jgi:hypothetical protein